jgi:hypothetical protein
MSLLGLLSTEDFSSERFTSIRRSVFYQYPNGAAPLLGLLSMLDGEVLNDPEFSWYEDRLKEKVQTALRAASTTGPWYANNAEAVGSALAATAVDRTAGTVYWLAVNAITSFRANDIINTKVIVGSSIVNCQCRIVANSSGVWYLDGSGVLDWAIRVTPLNTVASALNAYANYDPASAVASENLCEVLVLGNANVQGQTGSNEGSYSMPGSAGNYAQIFRTPYSFTGTALKTSAKFDESGPYKDKAKKASMGHMIQMELQFLFGSPSKGTDTVTGLPIYTTGGIMFFLRLWEAGNGGVVDGKTNAYGNTAATTNAQDNKRIIVINGNITETLYDDYMERLFRHTNNVSSEKMVFCGSGFLNVMNKLYKKASVFNTDIPSGDAYGMNVVKHVSPFGTVYYKTHPLFTRNAAMRYDALFFDAQNMKYRYLQDRDTDIKKNTQANNMDGRTDEWLTEAGMELQFPEANMYMQGVTGYA